MEHAISWLRSIGEFALRGSDFSEKVVMTGIPPTVAKDEATAVPRPSISHCPESRKHDTSTKKGIMFDKFFDQTVELSLGCGRKLTESELAKVKNFEDFGFPSRLSANIASAGYTKPTPIQQYAMKCIVERQDIIGCSPTGSGKTAAYLLPILHRLLKGGVFCISNKSPCKPRVLILVPSRELAIQIHQVISKFTSGTYCKCEVLYEGTPFEKPKNIEILKGVSILVGTTGRVKKFVDEGIVSLEEIQYLVLDEADRMLDATFAEDLKYIMRKGRIQPRDKRQTLLFSATFPALVKERLKRWKLLKDDHLMVVIGKIGAANKCIVQDVVQVSIYEKNAKLLELVRADREKYERSRDSATFPQKTLIFVTSKKMADDLDLFLCYNGISAAVIHAGREQARRESALDDFRCGRIPFLIATAVAERGLDIAGVDHVINYDMPKELDDYVYRIGRTGRIGNAGHSTSFIDPAHDGHIIDPLVNLLTQAEQIVPDWVEELRNSLREKSLKMDFIVDILSGLVVSLS